MKLVLCTALLLVSTLAWAQQAAKPDAYLANDRPADPRFKADILLVVAHPDDEVMATAYLAREIYDNHKRVAVVYETPGDEGNNDVGAEQGAALGDVRQIEARRAVGALGITNVFFLGGHDTVSQNVLTSLEHCGHGHCLDELVRIIRLTQPLVVLTWMPGFATGENHADHQAAGVLATEAFDLAGDPTAFPEQISPAANPDKNMNLTEGLRPWQPQKIYYFYNPTHDIFAGQGPQYSSEEVSPSQHKSYGTIAAEVFANHLSQGGQKVLDAMAGNKLATSGEIGKIATGPVRLIFGKSLVPSTPTEDVFAGVVPGGITYQRPPGFVAAAQPKPVLTIGDPWRFYHRFWQAHGIDHLANIVPEEVSIHVGGSVAIPLVVENPTASALPVDFTVQAPEGWKVTTIAPASVPAHTDYYLRVQAAAPDTLSPGWQQFKVSAQSGQNNLGSVSLRVELSNGWVAPQ